MRRLTLTFRILTLVCATMLIFSIAGVSAVWLYTDGGDGTVKVEIPVTMHGEWTGSDVLPDEEGFDHAWLIDSLLNATDENGDTIGLNNPNSDLNSTINDRFNDNLDTFGSMATWVGGNLDELFGAEAAELEFLIQSVDINSDGEIDYYYIYTIGLDLEYASTWFGLAGTQTIPFGEKIYPIYRTKVEATTVFEDGNKIWEATKSELGYADSAYYETYYIRSLPGIDPDTWTAYTSTDTLGTTIDDPIWTYSAYENTTTLSTNTTVAYYAICMPSTNPVFWITETFPLTVTSPTENCQITVYDSDHNVIGTSTTDEEGIATASFTATEERYYYIAVSGNTEISFTINQN